MAGRPGGRGADHQRILIAIDKDFIDEQHMREAQAEPDGASPHDPSIVVDAPFIAEMVRQQVLAEMGLHNPQRGEPRYDYVVTDIPLRFQTIGSRFLGREFKHVEQVRW